MADSAECNEEVLCVSDVSVLCRYTSLSETSFAASTSDKSSTALKPTFHRLRKVRTAQR